MSNILIVEGNEKSMKLVRDLLQHRGPRTAEAVDGETGVQMASAETRPELILMDIQQPDISGVEALVRIRTDPSLKGVPCLAVSASVMPDEQQRITASGFDGFIAKPISLKPDAASAAAQEPRLLQGRSSEVQIRPRRHAWRGLSVLTAGQLPVK